jgi:hypothetical protein
VIFFTLNLTPWVSPFRVALSGTTLRGDPRVTIIESANPQWLALFLPSFSFYILHLKLSKTKPPWFQVEKPAGWAFWNQRRFLNFTVPANGFYTVAGLLANQHHRASRK